MKHYHQLSLVSPEHPRLSRVIEAPKANMSPCLIQADVQSNAETAPSERPMEGADPRRHIANALTAIIVQAEATRRNARRLTTGGADIVSSSEHIIECAKRVWRMVNDERDSAAGTVI